MSSLRQRELGRLLGCGWIKRALFIGLLLLCSALIRGCVRLQSEVSERSAHSLKKGTTQTTHRAASATTKEGQNKGWLIHCAYAFYMTCSSHSLYLFLFKTALKLNISLPLLTISLASAHGVVLIISLCLTRLLSPAPAVFLSVPILALRTMSLFYVFPWCLYWNACLLKVIYNIFAIRQSEGLHYSAIQIEGKG